jgi:2'-5' RNA ligase
VPAVGAPQVRIGGGGRFGRGKFTVLWAGVRGDVDPLRALARSVRRELKRARLPYDDKPWKPHLTVARPGDRLDRAGVDADRELLAGYEGPAWAAREITLVRSHPGPKPRYDRLATWPV